MSLLWIMVILLVVGIGISAKRADERNKDLDIPLGMDRVFQEVYETLAYSLKNLEDFTIQDKINSWNEDKLILLFSLLRKQQYPNANNDITTIAMYATIGCLSKDKSNRSNNSTIIAMFLNLIGMLMGTYKEYKSDIANAYDVINLMLKDYFTYYAKRKDVNQWELISSLGIEPEQYNKAIWILIATNIRMYNMKIFGEDSLNTLENEFREKNSIASKEEGKSIHRYKTTKRTDIVKKKTKRR